MARSTPVRTYGAVRGVPFGTPPAPLEFSPMAHGRGKKPLYFDLNLDYSALRSRSTTNLLRSYIFVPLKRLQNWCGSRPTK